MPELTLTPVADKELWILKGENCALPAYVQQFIDQAGSQLWGVWPAMTFLHGPHKRFYDLLEFHSEMRSEKMLFFTKPTVIKSMMKKAPGVTPSYYYAFDGKTIEEDEVVEDIKERKQPLKLDEKFLKEVVSRTQVCSLEAMRLIWSTVVQVALQWMVTYRQPLNFGFVTLVPLPYRSNWKSVLLGAFPYSYRCFAKALKHQEDEMRKYGLWRGFKYKEILAINKHPHTCQWQIEAIPNAVWDEACERTEWKRHDAGKTKYSKLIARSIIMHRRLAAAAFRRFICGAVMPSAAFSKLAPKGTQILIPFTPKGGITPKAEKRSCTDICVDASTADEEPCLLSAIEREVDEMSTVQDLQQGPAELRITGGTVSRRRHGESG